MCVALECCLFAMSKLLHIQSSPRRTRSASRSVAAKFLETYEEAHADDEIETINLWQIRLPEVSGVLLEAAYAIKSGQPHSEEQSIAWREIVQICEQFQSADKYLLSVPMWNFSIPYKLKHYIDLLVHSGLTYSFTPEEGFRGLVTGKPLAVIYARGGAYRLGSGFESFDHQCKYVRQIFEFIGFTGIREVFVEPTAMGPGTKEKAIATAVRDAVELAEHF